MQRNTWKRALVALVVAGLIPKAGWSQVPLGGEFQVNAYATGRQWQPAVASSADGSFVVVWTGVQDGSAYGVFARRFSASGTPEGALDTLVNSYTTNSQASPAVAVTATGGLVVAWESAQQDGYGYGVFAQRYDDSLQPQGGEFRVNPYTLGHQRRASVASAGGVDFVVGWGGPGDGGDSDDIFVRRYGPSGVPQGSEFRVNSYTTGSQLAPSIVSDAAGNFTAVWISFGQDGSGGGAFGQRFSASGAPLGGEFQVDITTMGHQTLPVVAHDASGNFVVAWASYDEFSFGVWARRYDGLGTAQGPPFQVNEYTTSQQAGQDVAMLGDGSFVVVWDSLHQDGSFAGVYGRMFDASGAAAGGEFRVNSHTTGQQRFPSVSANSNGNFVVVWESYEQDGSSVGIFGQRFARDLIFRDGFD